MLSDDVLLALNTVRDEFLEKTWESLNKQATAQKTHRKISRTALIAAVIAALLTFSAFAIGYSFYKKHQTTVREELKIDENNVSGYVEYDEEYIPQTNTARTATIQLVSSIDYGEYIKVYFCLSPVSLETFEGTFGSRTVDGKNYLFRYFASNDERINNAFEMEMRGEEIPFSYDTFDASPGISLSEEETQEHLKEYMGYFGETYLDLDFEYYWGRIADAYDEETQSLFLQSIIRKSDVDTTKPIFFTVGLLDSKSVTVPNSYVFEEHGDIDEWRKEHLPVYLENYGTVVIDAAQADSRAFDFSNGFVELTNPSNAGKFKIMSASVYPTHVEIKVIHDDIQLIHNLQKDDPEAFQKGFEKQLEWISFYDAILQNSEILLDDGESIKLVPSNSTPYENGIVTLRSYFTFTIDISKVDKLKVCDFVVPII